MFCLTLCQALLDVINPRLELTAFFAFGVTGELSGQQQFFEHRYPLVAAVGFVDQFLHPRQHRIGVVVGYRCPTDRRFFVVQSAPSTNLPLRQRRLQMFDFRAQQRHRFFVIGFVFIRFEDARVEATERDVGRGGSCRFIGEHTRCIL